MTRCILIDPKAQTVAEVEVDTNDQTSITDAIACYYWEPVMLANGDVLLLDEEAMSDFEERGVFQWRGANQPFVGRGLLCGKAGEELAAPKTTLAEATANVRFVTADQMREFLARMMPGDWMW